jgi:hypothetical protein
MNSSLLVEFDNNVQILDVGRHKCGPPIHGTFTYTQLEDLLRICIHTEGYNFESLL